MKQTLYPKTGRISDSKYIITEKLDGSNIGFFRLNNELIIAQRKNVFTMTEALNVCKKDDLYKGMKEFLFNNGKNLLESLQEGSGFFCGMDWNG